MKINNDFFFDKVTLGKRRKKFTGKKLGIFFLNLKHNNNLIKSFEFLSNLNKQLRISHE